MRTKRRAAPCPASEEGDTLTVKSSPARRRQPPPRYTEATLDQGAGENQRHRPSLHLCPHHHHHHPQPRIRGAGGKGAEAYSLGEVTTRPHGAAVQRSWTWSSPPTWSASWTMWNRAKPDSVKP